MKTICLQILAVECEMLSRICEIIQAKRNIAPFVIGRSLFEYE